MSGKFAVCEIANYGMKMRRGIRVAQEEEEERGRARAGKFNLCKPRREENKVEEELQSSKSATSKTASYGMKMRRGTRKGKGGKEERGRARVAKLGFANNKEIKGPKGIKEQALSPLDHSIFSLHGEFMSCCSILHRDLILVKTIIPHH